MEYFLRILSELVRQRQKLHAGGEHSWRSFRSIQTEAPINCLNGGTVPLVLESWYLFGKVILHGQWANFRFNFLSYKNLKNLIYWGAVML